MNQEVTKKLIVIFCGVILISSLGILTVFATVTFDTVVKISTNISNDDRVPDITSSGTDVYVTWYDSSNGDILFKKSSDSGATFPISGDVGDAASGNSEVFPQIAVFGNNVHVVSSDGTNTIKINTSTDNGANFNGAIRLDANGGLKSVDHDVAISDSGNVYVVWVDKTSTESETAQIMFRASSDNGASFGDQIILDDNAVAGATTFNDPLPQVATSGEYVHVVWQDSTDIIVRSSANNGASFTAAVDLADVDADNSNDEISPQIASLNSGKNVFVLFSDNNDDDLFLSKSTDFGATFTTNTDPIANTNSVTSISTKLLLASGDNLYAVWVDGTGNDSIQFMRSTDQGDTFDTAFDVSENNSLLERDPRIAVDGSNVYVTWHHSSPTSQIKVASSAQGGAAGTFTINDVSGSTTVTDDPAIAASSGKVFVAWEDNLDGGSNNIFYKTGTLAEPNIQFDSSQYKLGSTATLTITNAASNTNAGQQDTIDVTVTSTTTPSNAGLYTLTETTNTSGIFTLDITLSETTTSGTSLKVSAGDAINAIFSGNGGQASIFDRTVSFNGITSFDRGSTANVKVIDQNSNLNTGSVESIEVALTTDADTNSGTFLVLTETGADTGIFGGSTSSLVFMVGNDLYSTGQIITVEQEESDDTDPDLDSETFTMLITSTSNSDGINLILTETAEHPKAQPSGTSIYSGDLTLSTTTSDSSTGTILVAPGDFLFIKNPSSGLQSSALIIPNSDGHNNAIQVNTPSDTVVATYKGASFSATVINADGESGGGGGGAVRVGLVVNALASLAGGGGSGFTLAPTLTLDRLILDDDFEMPSEIKQIVDNHDPLIPIEPISIDEYDFDFPLSINKNGFALGSDHNTIETVSVKTNEPVSITSTLYEESVLQHVSMHLNIRGDASGDINESDTMILYNKNKPLKLIDPNGFFESVDIVISEEHDDFKYFATFEIVFAKSMEKSDIVLRVWDDRLNSADIIILDAIEVFESGIGGILIDPEPTMDDIVMDPEPTMDDVVMDPEPDVDDVKQVLHVPDWIKNSVEMWSEDKMNDDTFIQGMQFLVQEQIINIPLEANVSEVKDKNIIIFEDEKITKVPKWVKDNAGWWSEGLLSDDEFILAMEYLLKEGSIKI